MCMVNKWQIPGNYKVGYYLCADPYFHWLRLIQPNSALFYDYFKSSMDCDILNPFIKDYLDWSESWSPYCLIRFVATNRYSKIRADACGYGV